MFKFIKNFLKFAFTSKVKNEVTPARSGKVPIAAAQSEDPKNKPVGDSSELEAFIHNTTTESQESYAAYLENLGSSTTQKPTKLVGQLQPGSRLDIGTISPEEAIYSVAPLQNQAQFTTQHNNAKSSASKPPVANNDDLRASPPRKR